MKISESIARHVAAHAEASFNKPADANRGNHRAPLIYATLSAPSWIACAWCFASEEISTLVNVTIGMACTISFEYTKYEATNIPKFEECCFKMAFFDELSRVNAMRASWSFQWLRRATQDVNINSKSIYVSRGKSIARTYRWETPMPLRCRASLRDIDAD